MQTESPNVTFGFCECGCGRETPIAKNTIPKLGRVRGRPIRYIRGHNSRRQTRTFDEKYVRGGPTECWEWAGRIDSGGYGRFGHGSQLAHRVAYQRSFGAITADQEIERTCGSRLCVNPAHLRVRDYSLPDPPNPGGICQCGCGLPAPIAPQTWRLHGWVKDEPMRFIAGHVGNLSRRRSLTPDLWTIEDRGFGTSCWIWTRQIGPTGYARIKFDHKTRMAHRVAYELAIGPIPDGHQIDHLCAQRACVNPAHLEAVTPSVNIRRGHARKRTRTAAQTI